MEGLLFILYTLSDHSRYLIKRMHIFTIMGMIDVRDLTKENLEDVFKVCSHGRMDDPVQMRGIELKRRWLLETLESRGPCTKIAYLDERPVGQILCIPEEAVPYMRNPREGVVAIRCVYNPFPETQRKGVGNALLKAVIDECRDGPVFLRGDSCAFLVAQEFTTSEGIPLRDFYEKNGFNMGQNEMYLEIDGGYIPSDKTEYSPLPEDRGRALMFFDPVCEWGIGFAMRVEEFLHGVDPDLSVQLLNTWENPEEYASRGFEQLVVNAVPIKSFWTDKDAMKKEVEEALRK